jgi:hypothetical protein
MPLPKIETPTYELTVPSTGDLIEYRPFLVKEEKILMLAQESGGIKDMVRALKQIISSCTFEKVDPNALASYDIEYIFLQLRAKSVGETSSFQLKCEHCGEYNPVEIDLTKVEVKFPLEKNENTIQLTENVGVVLRSIHLDEIENISDKVEDFTKVLALSIEKIYDDSQVYNSSDISQKEMTEFVESLSRSQVSKIEHYIENQPYLGMEVEFGCTGCGRHNSISLRGLDSFFG